MTRPQTHYLTVREEDGKVVLELRDTWRLASLEALAASVEGLCATRPVRNGKKVVLDGSRLEALDTAGAMTALSSVERCGGTLAEVSLTGFDDRHRRIAELVARRLGERGEIPLEPPRLDPLQRVGSVTLRGLRYFVRLVSFLGECLSGLASTMVRPATLRLKECAIQFERVCVDALGIVSLVMLLIGIVVAYLFAAQIEKYGANIFIVDGVSIAMARELSPIIVAIILAGRSGSAFAAQIGSMKLNEEVDAMRVLGLSPLRVLVLPRIVALVLAMPLLTFVGDVVGVLGGMVIADRYLDVSPATFTERLQFAFSTDHLFVGLSKAPVFALFIAVIGCLKGLTVENNTRSVGINTTATVVQSIVCVILLNAGFAVVFQELGI